MMTANSSTGTAHIAQVAKIGDYVESADGSGIVQQVYPDGSVRIVIHRTSRQVILDTYEVRK